MPSQAQDAVRAQVTKEFDAGAASQMPEIQQLDLSDGKGKALGGGGKYRKLKAVGAACEDN